MTDEQKEKLRREYEKTLLSQSACNLSGLVHSLSETMELIWAEATEHGQGTEYVNSHPIVRLYLEQMVFLCRSEYSKSYQTCLERSRAAEKKED